MSPTDIKITILLSPTYLFVAMIHSRGIESLRDRLLLSHIMELFLVVDVKGGSKVSKETI
jgi:hypothetical protein